MPASDPSPPVLDSDTLEKLRALRDSGTQGAEAVISDLCQIFSRDAAMHLEILRKAAATNDFKLAFDTAHALKGASYSVGAKRVAAACIAIEEQARSADSDPARAAGTTDPFDIDGLSRSVDEATSALRTVADESTR